MNIELKQQLVNIFNELPEPIQAEILSDDLQPKLDRIIQNYHIEDKHVESFQREVLFIMLGLRPLQEFHQNLAEVLEADPRFLSAIEEEVKETIFAPIIRFLENPVIEDNKEEYGPQTTIHDEKTNQINAIEKAGGFEIESSNERRNIAPIPENHTFANYNPKKVNLLADENSKEGTEQAMNKAGNIEIQTEDKQEFMEKGDPARFALPNTAYQAHRSPAPNNLPGEREVIGMTDPHTDALVDNLLDSGRE